MYMVFRFVMETKFKKNITRLMQIKRKNCNDLLERKKLRKQLDYQTKNSASKCKQLDQCPRNHRKRERPIMKSPAQRNQKLIPILS